MLRPLMRIYPHRRWLVLGLLMVFALMAWSRVEGAHGERIVSLAPNVTEVIYDLGLGDKVVAVSTYCNYPPEVKRKPTVGGMTNPSLELIAAMRPSLVILTDDGNPQKIDERLKAIGIDTYVYRAKKLADLTREIRLLGKALGVGRQAERRAGEIEAQLLRYKGILAKRSWRKAIFVVQPEPLMVAGRNTLIDDVFRHLGLVNIAGGSIIPYPLFSREELVRQSPHFIFIAEGHGVVAEESRNLLKKLAHLDAVKNGRVFYLGDPILRLGPRIVEVMEKMTVIIGNYP